MGNGLGDCPNAQIEIIEEPSQTVIATYTATEGVQTYTFTATSTSTRVKMSRADATVGSQTFYIHSAQLLEIYERNAESLLALVEGYRFGFQGQERDDELTGNGNSYTAEFWQYDARLGRRWNVDPVVKPHESPFAAFACNPILLIDPNGNDTTKIIWGKNSTWTFYWGDGTNSTSIDMTKTLRKSLNLGNVSQEISAPDRFGIDLLLSGSAGGFLTGQLGLNLIFNTQNDNWDVYFYYGAGGSAKGASSAQEFVQNLEAGATLSAGLVLAWAYEVTDDKGGTQPADKTADGCEFIGDYTKWKGYFYSFSGPRIGLFNTSYFTSVEPGTTLPIGEHFYSGVSLSIDLAGYKFKALGGSGFESMKSMFSSSKLGSVKLQGGFTVQYYYGGSINWHKVGSSLMNSGSKIDNSIKDSYHFLPQWIRRLDY